MKTWKIRWIISEQSCQFLPCDSELKLVSWWVNNFWKKKSSMHHNWTRFFSIVRRIFVLVSRDSTEPVFSRPIRSRPPPEGNILRSSNRLIAQQCVHGCPGWAVARLPAARSFSSSFILQFYSQRETHLLALLPTGYRSKSSVNIPENEVLRSFQERCKLVSFVSFNLSKLLDMINNRFHLHL